MKLSRLSFAVLFLALAAMVAVPHNAHAQQQVEQEATFEELITALEAIDAEMRALEQAQVQEVEVVSVGDIRNDLDDEQIEVLDDALRDADTSALRGALPEHEVITTALSEQGVAVGDVVAVNVRGESDVVVFYDPNI